MCGSRKTRSRASVSDEKKVRRVLMTPQALLHVDALKDVARSKSLDASGKRRTYTDRLAQLQKMADRLGDEIESADEELGKKLIWLREYAKILPLLERAERKHNVTVEKRSVDDLTDEELSQMNRDIVREEDKRKKRQ